MQYDVRTPDEYLSALERDWRRDTLLELRDLIRRNAPECIESIAYKMLSYEDDRGPVFALNAQKNYVSFYVGDIEKVDPTSELLHGLDCGKGCVRFRKSMKVAKTGIEAFIAKAAAIRRQGGDIDC